MKIGVIGTRGFPEIQGGIETHCMELYTRIASLGDNEITIYRRKPYVNSKNKNAEFKNIRFVDFYVPKNKYFETFLHSLFSTVHALFQGYDIVHYHNTGPGFFIPILKLSKAKIVFSYHNISYTQKKWNKFAKRFLHSSEIISIANSDFIIFVSEIVKLEIEKLYIVNKYKVLFNGVSIPRKSEKSDFLDSLGLKKQKYLIGVGRFLEEKGFDYLIRAFKNADLQDYKLVLVGDSDYPTSYSKRLKSFARENGVVLTGYIKGDKLNQIFTFAKIFILSSFEEGLPISLLEAMSFNIDVLASDIPANLQVGLNKDDYFRVGDADDLAKNIVYKISLNKERDYREILIRKFNWDNIALETVNIYKNLFAKDAINTGKNRLR
jgi:glycosyltransferase involved in cell wall biosynthesis